MESSNLKRSLSCTKLPDESHAEEFVSVSHGRCSKDVTLRNCLLCATVTDAAQKPREMIGKASLDCAAFKTYHMQSIRVCRERAFGDSIILMTS